MADFTWTATSPLQHATRPRRHGAAVQQSGIVLSEVLDFSLVLILARRGQWSATAKAAKEFFGAEAPAKPLAVRGKTTTLFWSGADQFYALFPRVPAAQPLDGMREPFAAKASLSDQSDGRCLIQISGPKVRAMLAKLSSLDLDGSVFPVGAAAATSIDHSGVNLWRDTDAADGSPVYNVLVFTSFADSIWHTILDSSAEYGVEVVRPHALDEKPSS
ncbi:sarcosine oxidase subunit gamma [Mycoplana dimorpha]|uniref:N-methylglutamate dehydrogenase subunit D n=1 Tax=Mycoplana dimorpha TaxID=28320 RepID=A0A2T5B3M5_MYCDI|nr:sarcosine oxidase subunit gamma family protein [Mycoplana dimorpha]PTM93577.1 N-methylglutamate dehydrogenase subunit D [Mycoplana dimorpha]